MDTYETTNLILWSSDGWPLTTIFMDLPDKKDLITEKIRLDLL